MKKFFAVLMLAAMVLSTGCGNNAMDGAKKDAQEAAAKVEQKADEVKKDAEAKVDEAKDAAAQKVDEAAAKVDEAKDAAVQKVDEIAEGAKAMRESMNEISFNGIVPGFSIDEVKAAYGEPVKTSGDELVFTNGVIVEVDDDSNTVESVRLTTSEVETPQGVAVGMSEYVLNDAYGPADKVDKDSDGVEYEYYRGVNKVAKLVFATKNGIISEIKSEFNK